MLKNRRKCKKYAQNLGSKPSIITINYKLYKFYFGHASKISLHTFVFDKNAFISISALHGEKCNMCV